MKLGPGWEVTAPWMSEAPPGELFPAMTELPRVSDPADWKIPPPDPGAGISPPPLAPAMFMVSVA